MPDGGVADLFLVVARDEGSAGEEGIRVLAVPADTPGVTRRILPTVDQTRKQGEVVLDGVRVPANAVLGGEEGGWAQLAHALAAGDDALNARLHATEQTTFAPETLSIIRAKLGIGGGGAAAAAAVEPVQQMSVG